MKAATHSQVAVQTSEPTPTRPTRQAFVEQVQLEMRAAGVPCDDWEAEWLDEMIAEAVAWLRDEGYGWAWHLSQTHINYLHDMLEVVMPPRVADPKPDSAHALACRRHLRGEELSLVHIFDERMGRRDCAVDIRLRTAA